MPEKPMVDSNGYIDVDAAVRLKVFKCATGTPGTI